MTKTLELPAEYLLHIHQEIEIQAPVQVVFDALLEQIGPHFDTPEGQTLPMKLEPWPGGRWFRDLGKNTGHLWGHVQVIKPPTLLEITGPLFMSYAAVSHVQYRLTEHDGGTRLTLVHRALGEIDPKHREGVVKGWKHILAQVGQRARR
jgi:uncharacterized protein YndB with AHSA1/START domain